MEEGYSYGYNNARDAVSMTPRRQIEQLLLPDQFMNLPSLNGYIKFPDGFPAAPVKLVPRTWEHRADGFIARAFDEADHQKQPDRLTPDEDAATKDTQSDGEKVAPADDDEGGKQGAGNQKEFVFESKSRDPEKETRDDEAPKNPDLQNAVSDADKPDKKIDDETDISSPETHAANKERSDVDASPEPSNNTKILSDPARDPGRDLREGAVRDEPDHDIGEYGF